MVDQCTIPGANRNVGNGERPATQRVSPARRLPRRSICHAYALPVAGDHGWSPALLGEIPGSGRPLRDEGLPPVRVAAFPSPDPNCRHHVFAEHDGRLKKLDLPSTARVVVSQRFDAEADNILSCSLVVLLYPGRNSAAGGAAAQVALSHLDTNSTATLLDRSISASDDDCPRHASRMNDSLSFTIPATGHYELRFITSVNPADPGAEAHLLVNDVRLGDARGDVVSRLASLSCVGRVRGATTNVRG